MSLEYDIKKDIIKLKDENIFIFPVLHNSPYISFYLRKALIKYDPDYIFIEQPSTVKDLVLKGVSRFPKISFIEENYIENKAITIVHPAEPLFEAVRTGSEIGSKLVFFDLPFESPIIDPDEILLKNNLSDKISLNDFWEYSLRILRDKKSNDDDTAREEHMGKVLRSVYNEKCKKDNKKAFIVCGISHFYGLLESFEISDGKHSEAIILGDRHLHLLHPDSFGEILEPSAFFIEYYEKARVSDNYNLQNAFFKLFKNTELKYIKEVTQDIPLPKKELFFRFSYKLALLSGSLEPSSLDMLHSARSCVDDDFAYHWYQESSKYQWLPHEGSGAKILNAEDIGARSISFRFRTKIKSKKRFVFRPVKKAGRKDIEKWKEQWQKQEAGYCSFQPEDIFLETYADRIKKKISNVAESKNIKTHSFSGSLLDGLDLRETLRNFHTKKLYVKENNLQGGNTDAIVVIFNRDIEDTDNKYNYKMTWWGENEQESDMAFYSTSPGEEIIGPGISRCEHGGFLLVYPRYSLGDVWKDPDYFGMRSEEVLMMAGIDHSIEGNIAVISSKPPSQYIKSWARRSGKRLIYIPIGSLSSAKIRRIRTFHILQGHPIRSTARQFIDDPNMWDDTDV